MLCFPPFVSPFYFPLNHFAAVCSLVLQRCASIGRLERGREWGGERRDQTQGDKGLSHFNVQPEWNANSKQCMTKSKLDL